MAKHKYKVGSLVKYMPDLLDIDIDAETLRNIHYGIVIEICDDTDEIRLSWLSTGFIARYHKNISTFIPISE